MTRVDVLKAMVMAGSHLYRFANDALPASVFENPVAFARGAGNPLKVQAVLGAVWDAAGGRLAGADRQERQGMSARLVRMDPYAIVHIQPPFPREVADACAIVVVGRGDGENQFDAPRYFIVELAADLRFMLVERKEGEEHGAPLGEAAPDVTGLLEQCLAITQGQPVPPRDRYGTLPPWYWWHVYRGAQVMRTFTSAPESEAWNLVYQHPILLLPELVDAATPAGMAGRATEGLRQMQASLIGTPHHVPYMRMLATAVMAERGGVPRINIERAIAILVEARAGATGAELGRTVALEASAHAKLAAASASLGSAEARSDAERRAMIDARRNYERARDLYEQARKEPAEPADRERDQRESAAVEQALAALAPPPMVTTDPAWPALFLDESELTGFQRREDRRDQNPIPNDRSYEEFRGVGAGSVVWLGQESWPMWRVIDTRWLFPSIANAAAYADVMVAHAGEGLPQLPVPAIGDGARGWGGIQLGQQPGTRTAGQVIFLRVGRMVAKLFVAEGPSAPKAGQALAQSMLFPYAEAIVRRAQWALPRYWLGIARGTEAANAFVQAPPLTAVTTLAQFPILALPEFPAAMATLGEAHRAAAQALWQLQAQYKSDYSYRTIIQPLVRTLLDERAGDPRVNAHAALALVLDMRRVDRDPMWGTLEAECRSRA